MFCSNCGAEVHDKAVVCTNCGCEIKRPSAGSFDKSEKDWVTALLLCFFLGGFGVHRFYVGKVGTGILQLITLGMCGVWSLIDFILIAVGSFTDAEGKKIVSK